MVSDENYSGITSTEVGVGELETAGRMGERAPTRCNTESAHFHLRWSL
jgi:hypothetical protein